MAARLNTGQQSIAALIICDRKQRNLPALLAGGHPGRYQESGLFNNPVATGTRPASSMRPSMAGPYAQ